MKRYNRNITFYQEIYSECDDRVRFEENDTVCLTDFKELEFCTEFSALSERIIICYSVESVYVVDLLQNQCTKQDGFQLEKKLTRMTLVKDSGSKLYIPFLLNNTVEYIKLPPFNRGNIVVEVINAEFPTCLFMSRNSICRLSIVDMKPIVEQFNGTLFFTRHYTLSSCFVIDDIYYFSSKSQPLLIAYKFGQHLQRLDAVSNVYFRQFTMFNNILYGQFGKLMYPFTIEQKVSGYGLLPDMPITMHGIDHVNPVIVSSRHSIHIDITSNLRPKALVHGIVKEGRNTLIRVVAKPNNGEIIYSQIYKSKDSIVFKKGLEECHREHMLRMGEEDFVDYVSNAFVFIENSYHEAIKINGIEFCAPTDNDWFYVDYVDNVLWISGSNYTGIAVLNDSGNVVDFNTLLYGDHQHLCVTANQYDPYCALQDDTYFVRYDPERKDFSKIFVLREGVRTSEFFIDNTVFVVNGIVYKIEGEVLNSIDIDLPWECLRSPEYSFFSIRRRTISRLHMRLDGYDVVVDVLKFDENYTTFTLKTERYNLLTMLAENSEFHPISVMLDLFMYRTSAFSRFSHEYQARL
ncbi:hypothetical protein PCE1_004390 [Barthelona sp. PCE]